MIYRTLRVDTLCTRSGSSWSTSCSLVYTQKQTTTSDRANQIKSSQIVILGHYIDLPKIPQPIYQQLCDSTTVETGQNSSKIRINWPYLGLDCERWVKGNTADPEAFVQAVFKVRDRFGLKEVVMVGDRGMITKARIEPLRNLGQMSWITCLRAPAIRALAEDGAIQLRLFDEMKLVEITHPDYPGERLVVCRNPSCSFRRIRTPIPEFSYTSAGFGGCIATDAGANAVLVVHLLWNYRRTVGLNVGYMAIDNCYFA